MPLRKTLIFSIYYKSPKIKILNLNHSSEILVGGVTLLKLDQKVLFLNKNKIIYLKIVLNQRKVSKVPGGSLKPKVKETVFSKKKERQIHRIDQILLQIYLELEL
jgi:hypothetical protein